MARNYRKHVTALDRIDNHHDTEKLSLPDGFGQYDLLKLMKKSHTESD